MTEASVPSSSPRTIILVFDVIDTTQSVSKILQAVQWNLNALVLVSGDRDAPPGGSPAGSCHPHPQRQDV